MKRSISFLFLFLLAAVLLCAAVLAMDDADGVCDLKTEANVSVKPLKADGTASAKNSAGIYVDAVRMTVTYSAAQTGREYLVLVLKGTDAAPTADNIVYIGQKRADSSSVSFDVYPKPMDKMTYTVYLSGPSGLTKAASFRYAVKHTHTPAKAVRENEHPAACTAKGSYDEVVYCSVCGLEISRSTKTVNALGHAWGEWKTVKEATVSADGSRERTCSRCGAKEKAAIPRVEKGDLNGNGAYDSMDLVILVQCIHGKQAPSMKRSNADLTGNGYIDYEDMSALAKLVRGGVTADIAVLYLKNNYPYEAMLVLRYATGKITAFPSLKTPVPATDGAASEELGSDEATMAEPEPEELPDDIAPSEDPEPAEPAAELNPEAVSEETPEPALLPDPAEVPAPEEAAEDDPTVSEEPAPSPADE